MKRTTIKDVAREAGVSITTVSHALNGFLDVSDKTKKRILEVAAALNYAPDFNARSLSGRNYKMVALLVSDLREADESGQVFSILSGVHGICDELGGEVALMTTSTALQKKVNYLQLCRSKNIDAVVITGLRTDDPYYSEIVTSEIPCVMVNSFVGGNKVINVSTDNLSAAKDAVNRLIALGHTRIAFINGRSDAVVSEERYAGYLGAFLENNIAPDSSIIAYADFEEDKAFRESLNILTKTPDLTAFFCASDIMAIGVLRAARQLNIKVPTQLSVIGFDDIPAAKYVEGGISTISQDFYCMGKEAGRAVFGMLNGEMVENKILVPYSLIERNTTGKIAQNPKLFK